MNVYNDSQNVHNHQIQKSIRTSIINILNDSKPSNDTIDDILKSNLSELTIKLLIEYSSLEDTYSTLNITFKELLDYVWARIMKHENREEIMKILDQEMKDTQYKCFTGKISRLVNCLNGFYDDVKINICGEENIGIIIIAIKHSLDYEIPNFVDVWKEKVRNELMERGYEKDVIDSWVESIE